MARHDRRRAIPAVAASLLVHLALLAVVMHVAGVSPRALEPVAEPDFEVQLVTRPPPTASMVAPPRQSRRVAHQPPLAVPRPAPPHLRVRQTPPVLAPTPPAARPVDRRTRPTPAAPRSAAFSAAANAPASPASGTPSGSRWTVQGENEGEDGVRKFLRATVGCSHADYIALNEQERATCDRRMGEEARSIGIPSDKIAGFIAAAQAQERRRADRTGPVKDLFVPCTGPGANLDRGCINMQRKHPEDEPY